jgi:hypothetical protein
MVGLGFALPTGTEESKIDKSGQVFGPEELEAVSLYVYMRAG